MLLWVNHLCRIQYFFHHWCCLVWTRKCDRIPMRPNWIQSPCPQSLPFSDQRWCRLWGPHEPLLARDRVPPGASLLRLPLGIPTVPMKKCPLSYERKNKSLLFTISGEVPEFVSWLMLHHQSHSSLEWLVHLQNLNWMDTGTTCMNSVAGGFSLKTFLAWDLANLIRFFSPPWNPTH